MILISSLIYLWLGADRRQGFFGTRKCGIDLKAVDRFEPSEVLDVSEWLGSIPRNEHTIREPFDVMRSGPSRLKEDADGGALTHPSGISDDVAKDTPGTPDSLVPMKQAFERSAGREVVLLQHGILHSGIPDREGQRTPLLIRFRSETQARSLSSDQNSTRFGPEGDARHTQDSARRPRGLANSRECKNRC